MKILKNLSKRRKNDVIVSVFTRFWAMNIKVTLVECFYCVKHFWQIVYAFTFDNMDFATNDENLISSERAWNTKTFQPFGAQQI